MKTCLQTYYETLNIRKEPVTEEDNMMSDTNYNGVWEIIEAPIKDGVYKFKRMSEAICDITVYDCTFAFLTLSGLPDLKVPLRSDQCNMRLEDITLFNPLFLPEGDDKYKIYTDGTKISYGAIYLDTDARKVICSSFYAPTKIDDITIMAGHMWKESYIERNQENERS